MPTNAPSTFVAHLLASTIAASALVGFAAARPSAPADDSPPAGQGTGGDSSKDTQKRDKKRDADRKGDRSDDGLLSGPKVGDDEVRDDKAFGKDGKPGKGGRPDGQRRPMADARMWMEALKSMELQGDQKTQVEAVVKKFEDARSAFEKQYGDQRRALEKKAKDLGGGPDGPGRGASAPAGQGGDSPDGKAIRKQMQELSEKAPKAEPFQKEIFGLLTPDQQTAFKKKLEEIEVRRNKARDQREKKADEMGGDGKRPARGEGGGAKRGANTPAGSGDGMTDDPMKGTGDDDAAKKPRKPKTAE